MCRMQVCRAGSKASQGTALGEVVAAVQARVAAFQVTHPYFKKWQKMAEAGRKWPFVTVEM